VLHSITVDRRGDSKIAVKLRATSRSAIAPVLSAAAACEAGELLLFGSIGVRDSEPSSIRVSLDKRSQDTARAHVVARYIIVALLVFAVPAIGWTAFIRWSTAGELALLERVIADRRAFLTRVSTSRATGEGLAGRKLGTPAAVMILERLSDVLPDDTHLTELSLEGPRLRISGISSQAAELVALLERSGHFRNASFYAPTMRIPGTLTDRFSIEAMTVAQTEAKP
jgi:general secretion pathway protein L